jgi:hypothetical protein
MASPEEDFRPLTIGCDQSQTLMHDQISIREVCPVSGWDNFGSAAPVSA